MNGPLELVGFTFTLLIMACWSWGGRKLFHPTCRIEIEDTTEEPMPALAKKKYWAKIIIGKQILMKSSDRQRKWLNNVWSSALRFVPCPFLRAIMTLSPQTDQL